MNDNLDKEEYTNSEFLNNNLDLKSHQDINLLIEDIKKFEEKFSFFEIQEIDKDNDKENSLNSPSYVTPNKSIKKTMKTKKRLVIKKRKLSKEVETKKRFHKKQNNFSFKLFSIKNSSNKNDRIKVGSKNFEKKTVIKPNVFHIGFDENGQLVNLDIKKRIVENNKSDKKSLFGRIIKKNKSESNEETDKEVKNSKFKGFFIKVKNIKKAIPLIRNKE